MIYEITTGATAALPTPTTNLAISINQSDGASAVIIFPEIKTKIPRSSVARLPITSPSFPRIGAKAAVDIDIARAVQVVLLYSSPISFTNAGPRTVVKPPIIPIKKAASACFG